MVQNAGKKENERRDKYKDKYNGAKKDLANEKAKNEQLERELKKLKSTRRDGGTLDGSSSNVVANIIKPFFDIYKASL